MTRALNALLAVLAAWTVALAPATSGSGVTATACPPPPPPPPEPLPSPTHTCWIGLLRTLPRASVASM